MDIEVAKYSGYCFGVKRALKIAQETLEKYKNKGVKIYTVGSIIHNPGVVEELSKKGINSVDSEEKVTPESILIVRSHGMSPCVLERLKIKGVRIIDATCPFVKKAQAKARLLDENGYFILIIGSKTHPEVKGIKENVKSNNCKVVESKEDIDDIGKREKIGVVVQTTQTMENFKSIVDKILEKGKQILIFNTICNTTEKRQDSTKNLSKRVDLMIVVGGKNSANTTHLTEISRIYNNKTYHIESYREINPEWLKGVKRVGISGGASTPKKDILKVREYIKSLS